MTTPQTSPMYSQNDLDEILAREESRNEVRQLQSQLIVSTQSNGQALADINLKISQLIETMTQQNKEQHQEREKLIDTLRIEIQKDFASKIDLINLSNRLDQLWIKISAAIITTLGIGGVIGWIITTAVSSAKLWGSP